MTTGIVRSRVLGSSGPQCPSASEMPPKKLYSRFVQIGRIVLVQYGPDMGKLATIIDIVDQNRVLIDGPANLTGVRRQVVNVKWLSLTDLTIAAPRNARQKTLTKLWTEAGVQAKWAATSWAKRSAAKAAKAALTDLGRFQAKVAHQARAKAVKATMAQ